MGRWYYYSKATVEGSLDVSIFRLRKPGMLTGNTYRVLNWVCNQTRKESYIGVAVYTKDDPHIRFIYTTTDRQGQKTDHDERAELTTTPCRFGGLRYWFYCPICGRRVAMLYLAPGSTRFGCRHCNNLTYLSRNYSVMGLFGHTDRRVQALRKQIKRWTWRGGPTRKV